MLLAMYMKVSICMHTYIKGYASDQCVFPSTVTGPKMKFPTRPVFQNLVFPTYF